MRPNSAGGAIQPAGRTERLLEDIRAFGRLRHVVRGRSDADVQERQLGIRLRKARQARLLSAAPESELGRVPHEVRGSSEADVQERNLGIRLRKARQAGLLSAAQESELAVLSDATQPAGTSEQLLQDIRAFGRVPHEVRG